jgi:archaellum component FlaC
MSLLTDEQIAIIVQYWKDREDLENEIQQLKETSKKQEYKWTGREFKWISTGFKKASKKIEELEVQIEKLDTEYEKWLNDEVGLELHDRNQSEFIYNIINNGIMLR